MKLTLLFLLVTLVAIKANPSYSQTTNISLEVQNVTVSKVIDEIERKTDFRFLFIAGSVDLERNVSLSYSKKSIKTILKLLFKNTETAFEIADRKIILRKINKTSKPTSILITKKEQAKVSGIVLDEFKTPLPSVTIIIKGTATGVITDFDGKFSIAASLGDVLVFSFVGMLSKELTISYANQKNISIQLTADILLLDEMVVTGTSALTSKKQLGNAISTIKSEAISNSGAQGVTAALSGKITGAVVNQNSGNPAGGISVTLRGASTVFGNSDPLYIMDGVIVDNSSTELLPLGGYAQNRLVDINPNDIDRIEVIKGAAAAAIYGSRASNGVVQIFTKKGVIGETQISFSYSTKINQLRKQIEENQEPFQFEAPGSSVLVPVERYQMQDRIFRTAIGSDYNLSLKGGTEKTQFFTSLSHSKNEGIIKNTDYKRYTLRANINHKINDWLKTSISTNYAISTSQELPNGGMLAPNEFFGVLTGFAFLNTNYNPERQSDGSYINNLGFTLAANPIAAIDNYDFTMKTNRFIGSVKLEAKPFENFSIEYILGYDGSTSRATAYIPIGILPKITGWSRVAEKTALLLNNDLNFSYAASISDHLKSISSLGFTQQYDRTSIFAITSDRLSPSIKSTTAGSIISRSDIREERSIRGAYFQQTFNLSDKLFVTGAIRLDQASTFGANERTQFYPKASMSYMLSDEEYWKNSLSSIFNSFKIRASYGEAGNLTALSAFDKSTNYSPVPINGQTGFSPDPQAGNLDIKPERQKEIEIGFDASTFKGRLGIEFSYYNVKVIDLLLSRVLAPSSGFSRRLENVGTLSNSGFELLLKGQLLKTKNAGWNILLNYSQNKNEVNDIDGGELVLPDVFDQAVVAKNGYPIGVFSGTYFIRDANGNISTDNNNLPITSTDRKIIGDPNPNWTGSLINEVNYKNWKFRMQLDAVMGFDVFNWTDRLNSHTDLFGGGARDAQEIRGELPRGYNAATFQTFERYIEDGSFVKLRELSLAYNFNFDNSKLFKSMTVSFVGRNLLSFDNYSGWDPEVSSFGQRNGVRGMDFNEVPIPRTYQLGLNISF